MTLLVGLTESFGGQIRSLPLSTTSFHHASPGGRTTGPLMDTVQRQSHPIDMMMIMITIINVMLSKYYENLSVD
jgi:hypothetical protein